MSQKQAGIGTYLGLAAARTWLNNLACQPTPRSRLADWAEGFENFVTQTKAAATHHAPAVRVQQRNAKNVWICPHCGQEITEKSIYRDAKGWTFHRPCFTRGKGSITLPPELEKASVEIPHVEQQLDYSCGPAALKAVEKAEGLPTKSEQILGKETHTDTEKGTLPANLIDTARQHGLSVECHKAMTLAELKEAVAAGKPVIVSVQIDAPEGWESGHYVVITGIKDGKVHFMDPAAKEAESSWSEDEFGKRWHDQAGDGQIYHHLGIVFAAPTEKISSLGSGPEAGQSATIPPRLVDASGATPAGRENQPALPAKKSIRAAYLDHCMKPPDPSMFNMAVVKAALAPFETMSDGTEETQEATDIDGVQWSSQQQHNAINSARDKLRQLAEAPGYQDSGAGGAGGRTQQQSSAGEPLSSQSAGFSAPTVAEDVTMQLDSTTAETGQKPHLSA